MIEPECINLYLENGKERSFQDRIYRGDKISPAITTSFRPYYLVKGGGMSNEIIQIDFIQNVKVRKNKVNVKELKKLLKENKNQSYKQIAEKLKVPITKKVFPTLTTENQPSVIETEYRIRKLTPRECWRLMGFTDEDFNKASKCNSNSQLYKQAGNSIVVNCLEEIFKQLF